MVDTWRDDLAEWLSPFVGLLGDQGRARMCPAYVEGLIGPGDRNSVQPMAMRSPWIKRAFGQGFIAYQTQLRLQQAARMIETTDQQISQIAYRLGFRSLTYLSQCYKSAFGVSPSTRRKATLRRSALRSS